MIEIAPHTITVRNATNCCLIGRRAERFMPRVVGETCGIQERRAKYRRIHSVQKKACTTAKVETLVLFYYKLLGDFEVRKNQFEICRRCADVGCFNDVLLVQRIRVLQDTCVETHK